jgi:uncharacterized integral membrane protein
LKTLINILIWLLRAVVFIALLGLSIKNSGPMELRFFFDQNWTAPVSVVVLAVFAAGVVVGLTAALSSFLLRRPRTPK